MLPIGLAHGVRMGRDVAAGAVVTEDDVALDGGRLAASVHREMVSRFGES
jgi:predicted homoserine dehydrogenase-like protein